MTGAATSASSAGVWSSLQAQLARPAFRAAGRNFSWLLLEKMVRLIVGVGVGVWIARYLGPTQYGVLGYCIALVTLVGVVTGLGLDPVVKRELIERPGGTVECLSASLVLRLAAGAVAYAAMLGLVWQSQWLEGDEPKLVAILGLLLFQPAFLVPDLWLQARLRADASVVVQCSALLICSAARVGLILKGGSLQAFAVVVVLEMLLAAGGIAAAAYRQGVRVELRALRLSRMRTLLREAWPLALAGVAVVVYMRIDEVMLRQMVGPAAVGVYGAAARLSELSYFLPTVLASSLLPALLRARARGSENYEQRMQHYYDLSAAVAYAVAVVVTLAAGPLVRVAYGSAFAGAAPVLSVHVWSCVFVFLGVARGQWLVNERLPRFYLAATLAGAVINVALNLFAIPRWGGLGAAWTTLLSYAAAAWLASYFHPAVRRHAEMQTRALLIPLRGWRYLRRP